MQIYIMTCGSVKLFFIASRGRFFTDS